LFFDEVDGLCTTRSNSQSDSGVSDRVLTQFLAEMDGVEELCGVFVLAATNRPDRVDPALRIFGRFETTIEIGLPDLASRTEILGGHFNGKPIDPSIDIDSLAQDTEGFSGADLAALCSAAARHAIRRTVEVMDREVMDREVMDREVMNRGDSAIDELLINADDVSRAYESTKAQLAGRNGGVNGT
jgi:transitional endoplasmic reticulum ATPase